MALDVSFCKDLIVNAANSPVRTFTLFPKRYFHFIVWTVGTGKYLKPKIIIILLFNIKMPDRVAQSVGLLTHKSGVLGSIPGLATYFRFSFRFFKKGSCQLLAKVCARSTG